MTAASAGAKGAITKGAFSDLFGTLVRPFRRAEHEQAIAKCASILGLPFEVCHEGWVSTFPRRIRGEFPSVAANFSSIAQGHGLALDVSRLELASDIYLEFTQDGLLPLPGALDLLGWLRDSNYYVGLISNCAPDVPVAWSNSEFFPYFDHCTFSCQAKTVKPEAAIYQSALAASGLDAASCVFVGDGSDDEISGAADCGLEAILVSADLSNTYDSHRRDVVGWRGAVIPELAALRSHLATIA